MCFETMKENQFLDTGKLPDTPTPASILNAGVTGAGSTIPGKQSGLSKTVNNPLTQGAAGAAGVALAPATAGLSMLIPVVAKMFGGLLGKKPPRSFGPLPNTDAGLTSLASTGDPLDRFKANSFGGM